MNALASQQLDALLGEVAAATPAPGGGSSAALATALAAALVEMAARLRLARDAASSGLSPDAPDRALALRAGALELAERELSSYAQVLEARRLPAGDPDRAGRVETALTEASQAPLAIAETAAETATLAGEVARASNPSVRGDALTGAVLAEAAAAAAATLVEINLAGRDNDPTLERARAARRRAGAARQALGA